MTDKYFGTDGIRGRANGKLTPDLALKVGQATGLALRRDGHHRRVVIGKDTRMSCDMIEGALLAGFTSVGTDVALLGSIPTPAVAMATRRTRSDLGVMISASHNPYQDNGIKLFGPDGYKLSEELEAHIETLLDSDVAPALAGPRDIGCADRTDFTTQYVQAVTRSLGQPASLRGMRVVIDCANGAAWKAGPDALRQLGADVTAIGVEPDGFNINAEVGSTAPEALARKVLETRADVGIALDGDADRLVLVDEKGQLVDGDQLLAVLAKSWRDERRLARPGIVATIMSNMGLEKHLAGLGLTLERTAVGDRHVIERMREAGYNLGGEQSGHLILGDHSTTGDGLDSAIQLLGIVQKLDRPVSEVCHRFEPLPQVLRNAHFGSGRPLENAGVVKVIGDANARLRGHGRLVVRASGTEPLIRVMGEADDLALIDSLVESVCDAVARAA